jgi:predicted MPP superfamily phosphohydrolase
MKVRLTRRRFLLASATTAAAVGAYTWRIEPHWVSVVRRDMPVRNLPSEMAGRTVAQISDIHVCPYVDHDYLDDCLRTVSAAQPDLVVVTGDFMSQGSAPERLDDVARVFENLAMPPLGCFATFGNHDYGERWANMTIAEKLEKRLAGLGITVLRNTSRVVNGLRLAGVDDLWSPNFRPKEVLSTLTAEEPTVVLCHNPDAVDRNVWGDFRGWILSGHTHGGQCKPPFLPPPMLPVNNKRWTSGEFDLGDGRMLYINRGLGHLWRVRFNVRPEVTLFTLARA